MHPVGIFQQKQRKPGMKLYSAVKSRSDSKLILKVIHYYLEDLGNSFPLFSVEINLC